MSKLKNLKELHVGIDISIFLIIRQEKLLHSFIILSAYISMAIATVVILYCSVQIPDMSLWCEKTDELAHKSMYSYNVRSNDPFC